MRPEEKLQFFFNGTELRNNSMTLQDYNIDLKRKEEIEVGLYHISSLNLYIYKHF